MSKRVFIWVMAITISGVLLAGCGSDDNDSAGGQNASQNGDESNAGATSNGEAGESTASASENKDKSADTNSEPANLIFGTGGTSGTYYPIGGALKGVFEKSDRIGDVQVVSTGASVQNINNIEDGTNQMAIVMSDVAYDAINGQNQFKDRKADIKTIAGLYPNVVQIVATANSGIKNVADMKGKRIGVGKVGSGVEASAKKVLESAGMSYDDLGQVSHTGYADSVTGMQNGNIDAAFFTSGVPNSAITGLMQNAEINFINVDGSTAKKLLKKYPYYEKYKIAANKPDRYGLKQTVTTVAIRNILIVPGSMNKTVARDLAKRFYDYLGSDKVSIGALTQFDRASMDQNLVVPLASGAKAFYSSENVDSTNDGSGNASGNGSSDGDAGSGGSDGGGSDDSGSASDG